MPKVKFSFEDHINKMRGILQSSGPGITQPQGDGRQVLQKLLGGEQEEVSKTPRALKVPAVPKIPEKPPLPKWSKK